MIAPRFAGWVALTAAMLVPAAARADLSQFLGTTPRATSLANAYTALADDASALYFNPAGLTQIGGSYAGVSFVLTHASLNAYNGTETSIPAPSDDDFEYGFHFAWNPRGLLQQRLGLGFSVLLPHRRALSFAVHRLEEPYFVLYENSVQQLEIRLGAAYRIFDFLSVGVSALLLGGLDGKVFIAVPFQDKTMVDETRRTIVALNVFLPNREFFTAGIQLHPMKGLSIGLTYREPTFVPVALPLDFKLEILTSEFPTTAGLDVKVKYSPEQLVLGAAYQITDDWLVSLDLDYARYSKYLLPFADVKLDTSQLGDSFVLLQPTLPTVEVKDLLIPRIGVEWATTPALKLRAGYSYSDSFIKSAANPTLDSVKHSFSAGAGYTLDSLLFDPKTDPDTHLTLMASALVVVYTQRQIAGYDFDGTVYSANLGAEFRY